MFIIGVSLVIDVVLLYASLIIAIYIRFGNLSFLDQGYRTIVLGILITSSLIGMVISRAYVKRFVCFTQVFKSVFRGLLFGILLTLSIMYVFRIKLFYVPSSILFLSFFCSFILISIAKILLYRSLKRIFRKVEFVTEKDISALEPKKLLNMDEIVLTSRNYELGDLYFLIELCGTLGIKLSILPSTYQEMITMKLNHEKKVKMLPVYLGEIPDESLIQAFDYLVSLILLFMLSPLIILVCLLIKIDSPGPVIFKQKRIGRHGEIFTIYKFRSMVKDAGEFSRLKKLVLKHDSRVTRLGKILRKTRIDEIPQLFNVLKGDMRLVGPRPEAIYRVREYKALQSIRLSVKPGLTGLAQIEGDYFTLPRHKLRYDFIYLKNRSLGLNIRLLLKTFIHIFSSPGS